MSADGSTLYGTPAERSQAATEALRVRRALEPALRAADATVREHNALHGLFRPRSRSGRRTEAALRKAMPAHAQAAAVTADRLREQRRVLNKIADILGRGARLDVYLCGPALHGIDVKDAPALSRILDRWRAARAVQGEPVPADSVSAQRAALQAQIAALADRANRLLADRERRC